MSRLGKNLSELGHVMEEQPTAKTWISRQQKTDATTHAASRRALVCVRPSVRPSASASLTALTDGGERWTDSCGAARRSSPLYFLSAAQKRIKAFCICAGGGVCWCALLMFCIVSHVARCPQKPEDRGKKKKKKAARERLSGTFCLFPKARRVALKGIDGHEME